MKNKIILGALIGISQPVAQSIHTSIRILPSDKFLQVLLGDPKICPTDPTWQTATFLKNCHIFTTV